MLTKKVENIRLVYYRRSANELANRIVKETLCVHTFKRCY